LNRNAQNGTLHKHNTVPVMFNKEQKKGEQLCNSRKRQQLSSTNHKS